jgi:hypothetical protein
LLTRTLFLGTAALVGASLATGCSDAGPGPATGDDVGEPQTVAANEVASAFAGRVLSTESHVLSADRDTTLAVMTDPGARCDLHAPGLERPENGMRLMADSGGKVIFRFKPESASSSGVLHLDCQAPDGTTTRKPLLLQGTVAGSGEGDADMLPSGTVELPALADPDGISPDDLAARGYPRRPDSKDDPRGYAAWRSQVARPLRMTPRVAAVPSGQSFAAPQPIVGSASNFDEANWSGCFVEDAVPAGWSAPVPPFVISTGEVTVPSVGAYEANTTTAAAAWIGMGGFWDHTTLCVPIFGTDLCFNEYSAESFSGNTPIIQAGTVSEANYSPGRGTFSSYFAWYEYETPQPAGDPHVGWVQSFNVNPGDTLIASAEATDANGNLDAAAPYASFLLLDLSDLNLAAVPPPYAQPPTTQPFVGETTEVIMERPRFNGVNSDLAAFGSDLMWAQGQTLQDRSSGYWASPNQTIAMIDDGTTLSTAAIVPYYYSGNDSVPGCSYSWLAYH